MELDPQNAITAVQIGLAQLSGLAVTYSLSVLGAIILLIVGYFAAGMVQRALFAGLSRIRGFDSTLCYFFSKVARYAILVLVVVMVLGQFGVQTASIIAAIGAIGLAVGLALQGTLQNIAAGIMLLALRPFRIGEYVEIGAVDGTIEEIGLFATTLRTVDGVFVLAPNSTLWNQPVRNLTRNGVRRNDITIGIGYDDNIDLAQATFMELATGEARIRKDPAPITFVNQLADSSVTVTLRYWTSGGDFLSTKFDLTKKAKLAFDAKGITIPFPQQEVVYRDAAAKQ